MGMYSFFSYEDINVKDWNGLKEFLKLWIEAYGDEMEYVKNMIKKDENRKEYLTFEDWNDIKLISYWYDETLIFLYSIARYIEGMVEWDFESREEAGYVEFINGECKITTGVMNWVTWKPTDDINIEELDEKQKKILILSGLK